MASVPDAPIPFDLGPRTPLHLPQIARSALIQGSELDIFESTIPEIISTPTPAPAPSPSPPRDEAVIEINLTDVNDTALALPLAPPAPQSPSSQGRESIHDFHHIDQYIDFNPRQRQSTRHPVM
ncbi:hypothetical protein BKA56DRAFT_626037 [Ilyonectria sp. MPI-CAGE-AT-0026]|nr:hypothetical protein BKA56DRAFT_626037 [Ilyonectria sp. MPI-CAGE-AT-0026]